MRAWFDSEFVLLCFLSLTASPCVSVIKFFLASAFGNSTFPSSVRKYFRKFDLPEFGKLVLSEIRPSRLRYGPFQVPYPFFGLQSRTLWKFWIASWFDLCISHQRLTLYTWASALESCHHFHSHSGCVCLALFFWPFRTRVRGYGGWHWGGS